MLILHEARERIAAAVRPLAGRTVPLHAALGARLAEDAVADTALPLTNVSAMDGYALRVTDLAAGTALPVAFTLPAGVAPAALPAGAAARIFTGAALPDGADAVVAQEDAIVVDDGRVRLADTAALAAGENVRAAGELFRAGATVARAGDLLTPQRLALLAAAGVAQPRVVPPPRVAVLLTGRELVPAGVTPRPGQVRDSNGVLLAALAHEAGFACAAPRTVTDEPDALRAALEDALGTADLVVTSGGVSVGDFDHVPRVLDALGAETLVHGVAIKPGKPVLVARVGERWVVGLPGNPLACLVAWRLFVRPLGAALGGDAAALREEPRTARLAHAARNAGGRTLLRPAIISYDDSLLRVTIVPWQGSHDVVAGASAGAIAVLEPRADLAVDAPVGVYPLPWSWPTQD